MAKKEDKVIYQYVLFLLKQCYQTSQKNNKLLFWFSLLNEWFGLTWTGRSLYQQQQFILPKTTYRRLKKHILETVAVQLSEELKKAEIVIFWMDNFSKIYISDYNYKYKDVPWELRNLTATAAFILPQSITKLDFTILSLNSPLPLNTDNTWKSFWNFFFFKVKNTKKITFTLGNWIQKYTSSNLAVNLNLHTTFKPLELLDFNPSTIQGNLSALYYLKSKYPTSLPFTIIVADIAFVTKWWKLCLTSKLPGNFYKLKILFYNFIKVVIFFRKLFQFQQYFHFGIFSSLVTFIKNFLEILETLYIISFSNCFYQSKMV